MKPIRRHLNYANIVATLALLFAMGGSAIAANHYLINSTKQINPKVLKKLKGQRGRTGFGIQGQPGPTGKNGAQGAKGTDGTKGADGAKGAEGPAGLSALSTLPSGRTESGDYGIRTPNTGTSGFLDTSITFPIPLSVRIPKDHILYATIGAPVAHCSGPGSADPGYLCIYSANRSSVSTPPTPIEFEDGSPQEETGLFGFDLEWGVTGVSAFDVGTYSVTTP